MVKGYSMTFAVWSLFILVDFNILGALAYPLCRFRKASRPSDSRLVLASKTSPTDNITGQPTRSKGKAPPSSRSTATFALHESSRRPSAIALRILENDPDYRSLDGRDRAFARLLLTTTERRQGQINKIIQKLSHNKKTKKVRLL
jgi:hypothetical protein